MRNLRQIAVCGSAGSGKDTLAYFLMRDYGFENIKFSQPVKDLVSEYLDREINKATDRKLIIDVSFYMKGEISNGEMIDRYGYDLMQFAIDWCSEKIGQNVIRNEFFWAEFTANKLKPDGLYVFTDIRLPSEYKTMRNRGVVFVRLNTPREICEQRMIKRDGGIMPGIWENPFESHWQNWQYDFALDGTRNPMYNIERLIHYVSCLEG
jgi:dephospho-CoA kinase